KNKRIKAIGNVEFDQVEASVDRLCTYLSDHKIIGVKMYPGYEDYYPNDDRLNPLYEFCQRNGFPVIFHSGILQVDFPGLLEQAHPLKIDAVAHKFPNLNIIIAHLGNPWIIDCAAVLTKNRHVYADFSALTDEYEKITDEAKEHMANAI